MILGFPGSGKSSRAERYVDEGYVHLNRDAEGGSVRKLIPKMREALATGDSVVLDNLFPTANTREPFVAAAAKAGVPIRAEVLGTGIEDSIINTLHRTWRRYETLFLTSGDIQEHEAARRDPNVYPIAVHFRYRKQREKPTVAEGFAKVETVPFTRRPLTGYEGKALILDYDGTLRRTVGGNGKFPTAPSQVEALPGRREKLLAMQAEGYRLLGVSNQSGVSKGDLDLETARVCFDETDRQLGVDIETVFCPHGVPPRCYCRKPQSGLGVLLIHRHRLDPAKCIFVGDQKTDQTWAKRLGMQYADQATFFA